MANKKTALSDQKTRCGWVGNKPHFIPYHDKEWGEPVHDDHRHFEMLILEGAQAGLSWSTILLRREGYRKAFAGFDPVKVAKFDARKETSLLKNTGIIRNRLKIKSAITNAKAFLAIQKEFGSFDTYIWEFVGGRPKINKWKDMSQVPATTLESDALSKDLKKRGFSFVGSTVIYAHMQAAGLVNDHTADCFRHPANNHSDPSPRKTKNKKPAVPLNSDESKSSAGPTTIKRRPPTINLKRIYESPSKGDGIRILVDRLWPRGVTKESAALDLWLRDLAPSTTLRKWFNHDSGRWQKFLDAYSTELDQQKEEVTRLKNMASRKTLTFLYSAKDQECNNAKALKMYLEKFLNE